MDSFIQKSRYSLLFLLIFSLSSAVAQQISEVQAALQQATIYGQGASLHHTTEAIQIPRGNSEVVINQISRNVDPQSIRVLSQNNQITILSVSFERDYLASEANQSSQYRELKNQHDNAVAALNKKTNARKAEESALALLEANKDFGGQSGVSPASLTAMIKYYREEYKKLSAAIIELKKEEGEQQKVVDKLKNQLAEAGGNGQNAGQLVVRLHSAQPVKAEFSVEYFTSHVSWTPFYEIRLDRLDQPLQLVYKANVSQSTGIDWKQVKLAFSSGNPRRNNNAPQLNPWWIGFQSPGYNMSRLQSKVAGAQVQAEMAEEEYVNSDMAVVNENQLTTSFEVTTPYDIYSNQKPQAVQLKTYDLPATYTYFTAPRLYESAFLVAKVKDWHKYNLLPGEANLIIDNSFAGSSFINPNSTEDELTLSLGRDDRIIASRKRIDEEGSTSFFGKHQKRIFTYEISIKNTRKENISLEVKEQFPLSTEKDIEIKLLETSGAKVDNDKGELIWNLDLKSGETKKLVVSYSVKAPKDKRVVGM